MGHRHETGHFTQLVWKATKTVGCGRTECDGQDKGKAPGWCVCFFSFSLSLSLRGVSGANTA